MSVNGSVVTHRSSRLALAVVVTCQLMIGIDVTIVTIALPHIQTELGFSHTGLSWVVDAYMITLGGLLLLGGRAGDILGRRRVFMAGVTAFTVASLAGGLAQEAWQLVAARAVQGMGAAIAGPSILALIATTFSEGTARNRALSVYSAVTGAGASIGLLVGGLLTQSASWRWAFLINVPIGVAVVLLSPRFIHEPDRRPGRFDVTGAVLVTGGMVALVYGLITDTGWRFAAFTLAAVLLSAFVLAERRAAEPILPLHLFSVRDRATAYTVQALFAAAMFGSFFLLTHYIQGTLGLAPVAAGLAFLPMTISQFSVVRVLPRVLPRYGPKPFVLAGVASVTVGIIWLAALSADASYWVLAPMALMGFGGGMGVLPLNTMVLAGVPPQESGAASGTSQTMLWSGAAFGSALLAVTGYGGGIVLAGLALLVAVTVFGVAGPRARRRPRDLVASAPR